MFAQATKKQKLASVGALAALAIAYNVLSESDIEVQVPDGNGRVTPNGDMHITVTNSLSGSTCNLEYLQGAGTISQKCMIPENAWVQAASYLPRTPLGQLPPATKSLLSEAIEQGCKAAQGKKGYEDVCRYRYQMITQGPTS